MAFEIDLGTSPRRSKAGRGVMHGLDLRTSRGRRFRALLNGFVAELGDDPNAADLSAARSAAALALKVEDLQSACAKGEIVDTGDMVRASRELGRLTAALRARRAPKRARGAAND